MKVFRKIVTVLLIILLLFGLSVGIYFLVKNGDNLLPLETKNEVIAITNKGEELKAGNNYNIPSAFAFACSDTASNKSLNLVASFKPEYALDTVVDWGLFWENPNSPWASGKVVFNYVSLDYKEEKTNLCTVTYKMAFSERIIIKVSLRSNPDNYTICTVDCMQVLENVINHFELNNDTLASDVEYCDGYYKNKTSGMSEDTFNSLYPHTPSMSIRKYMKDNNVIDLDRLSCSHPSLYEACYILSYVDGITYMPYLSSNYTIPYDLSDILDVKVDVTLRGTSKEECSVAGLHPLDSGITFSSFEKKRTGFYDPSAAGSYNYEYYEASINDFSEDILKKLFTDSLDMLFSKIFNNGIRLSFDIKTTLSFENSNKTYTHVFDFNSKCFEVVVQDIVLDQENIVV